MIQDTIFIHLLPNDTFHSSKIKLSVNDIFENNTDEIEFSNPIENMLEKKIRMIGSVMS